MIALSVVSFLFVQIVKNQKYLHNCSQTHFEPSRCTGLICKFCFSKVQLMTFNCFFFRYFWKFFEKLKHPFLLEFFEKFLKSPFGQIFYHQIFNFAQKNLKKLLIQKSTIKINSQLFKKISKKFDCNLTCTQDKILTRSLEIESKICNCKLYLPSSNQIKKQSILHKKQKKK